MELRCGAGETTTTTKMLVILMSIMSCLLLLIVPTAQGDDVHYYDFVLKETNFTRLCSSKMMMTVNDSFPGPVIRAHKGDTIYVNVYNQGNYGVTIHWHGVKQPRNSWFDGPEYITQCPIEVGTNFTYKIILSDEEGTLWWHAHSDWTRSGVHGAIVILPKAGKSYPFPEPDGEEVVILASWYEVDVNEAVALALEVGQDTPTSVAYTINGQPGDLCSCSSQSTYHRSVDYGKTYLIRLVNAVMNVEMFFGIDQHNLTVVGMDGAYVKPITTSYVMISSGQTMDILVTTNQSLGRYYMATRQFDTAQPGIDVIDRVNATAILQYNGNYTDTSSLSLPDTLPEWGDFYAAKKFTSRIRSLANEEYPIDVPTNITTHMFIVVSMNEAIFTNDSGDVEYALSSSLNNYSWASPSTDVLMAYYKNLSGFYTTDFPDRPLSFYNFTADDENVVVDIVATKVKMLNYNEEVEIIFQGTNIMNTSENHPMHLHGYAFYVVGSGTGNFNNETDPENFNLIDPPELNTISVPKKGWVALRFRASNPGVWLWHCHFDRHFSWGMNTVIIVKNGGTPETSLRDPPSYMPPCKDSVLRTQNADSSSLARVE